MRTINKPKISIKEVCSDLVRYKKLIAIEPRDADSDEDCYGYIDVRLQMQDDGSWDLHFGDASYDQDHRGYWGASSICKRSNCREIAKELVDQAMDSWHQCNS